MTFTKYLNDRTSEIGPLRNTKLNGLQIFRGIAALAVLFYHINLQFSAFVPGTPDIKANPIPWTAHRLGFLGVDFFFVLSGFIIYHIHRVDLGMGSKSGKFFLKRLFRIQPLLWIIILVKQVYLTLGIREPIDWSAVFNTMFCLPGHKMIGVAWTLTFEWMFYLFFLICIFAGRRWLLVGGALWSVVVLSLGHIDLTENGHWIQVAASPYVFQFLCGVVAAEFHRRTPDCPKLASVIILCISLALIGGGIFLAPFNMSHREWVHPSDMAYGRLYWGLAFGILVWWTSLNDIYFKNRMLGPLILIGNASYAIYLFHNEMLQAFIRIGKAMGIFAHGNAVLWMWTYTTCILFACILIHLLIELPILNASKTFMSRVLK